MMNLTENILPNISKEDFEKMFKVFQMYSGMESKVVITLRVFRSEYIEFIKGNRSKAYLSSVEQSLQHLVNFFGEQKPIQSLTFREIEKFSSDLIKKVPRGYSSYLKTLKASFNKGVQWEYLTENHFTKIKLPKKQQAKPSFINEAELKDIVSSINNDTIKNIIITSFYTGMRLSEVVNMTWKYIDLKENEITVGGIDYTTKTRKQRVIPMCESLKNILLSIQQTKKIFDINNDYVFCKPDRSPYTGDFISKKFKKASKAAGYSNEIHFHSLRHSTATILANKNVPLHIIQEILGHSDIRTTMIYSHVSEQAKREAVKVFD